MRLITVLPNYRCAITTAHNKKLMMKQTLVIIQVLTNSQTEDQAVFDVFAEWLILLVVCLPGLLPRLHRVPHPDRCQPAAPEEARPARQQVQGAPVCGVQPLPAPPRRAGGCFLVRSPLRLFSDAVPTHIIMMPTSQKALSSAHGENDGPLARWLKVQLITTLEISHRKWLESFKTNSLR